MIMIEDESADDYFEPSPVPAKRRRLNSEALDTGRNNGRATTTGQSPEDNSPFDTKSTAVTKKTQKRKHLVHIHEDDSDLEETFHTQLPELDSSPWRVRGPRWKKQESAMQFPPSPSKSNEAVHPDDSPIISRSTKSNVKAPADKHVLGSTEQSLDNAISHQLEPNLPDFDFTKELEDLPSDAFDSSSQSRSVSPSRHGHIPPDRSATGSRIFERGQNVAAPKKGLRQMTLFGDSTNNDVPDAENHKVHNWPLAAREEPPTHHKLDLEALKTYVYPVNLGAIRDYQFSIVKRGLYHNLLVALPTGLGKTFIAATIMMNWYRWTEDAKIVFVAPTKPLVAQQVEACFRIAGIPRSHTTMLTGGVPPGVRAEEWSSKRVFFMTPQTIINDLKTGICDPKKIVLLVVDEAHRATGSYAYVEVVKLIRRFNQSFRILALTATPGNSVETVQEVIDGLDIARVEIRTEFSIDIRQYVHNRNVEQILFDNSEEMEMVMDLFSKALQPVLSKLRSFGAFWSADPMQLTPWGLTQARQKWFATTAGRNANFAVKGMLHRMFAVLASLAHNIDLLKFHGIGPFHHNIVSFQNNIDGSAGNKYEKEIAESNAFREMVRKVGFWVKHDEFLGHPKLEYLQGVALEHFMNAGEGRGAAQGEPPAATRIMIFVHFRDSAEEIVRVLKRHEPLIRPHVFVGQAAAKGSEGMDQKRQLDVIQKFKAGVYNTLVATSIGEEGLDIGEIDLIVCYDSSSSPIRMLQRMGRTGRKRAGNIVLLLMKGKEERAFAQAKDNYEKMQQMIADAKRFQFHDERSKRIVPKSLEPIVDKRTVEIPPENTQVDFLPEPKKSGKVPKRPPKKFNMPDGARTSFINASRLDDENDADPKEKWINKARSKPRKAQVAEELEVNPLLSKVLLTKREEEELRSRYQDIQAADEEDIVIGIPNLGAFPRSRLAPVKQVEHGLKTKTMVRALKFMGQINDRLQKFNDYSEDQSVLSLQDHSVARNSLKAVTPDFDRPSARTNKLKRGRQNMKPSSDSHSMTVVASRVAEEAPSSSPPATDAQLQLQSQGISLGSDTSGVDEDDAEPSSELRKFVVNSDDSDAEETGSCSESESCLEVDTNANKKAKAHRIDVSSEGSLDGNWDSSLPDLQSIIRGDQNAPSKNVDRVKHQRARRVIDGSSD